MSVNHIYKCPKCGYEENVWFDDKNFGYRPTCRTKTCDEYGKEIYNKESLADMLFDKEDLLESGESLQDYYECMNDYLDNTMNI